ncbi:hypothetical protein GCM10027568_03580 [Humibacter soli]
MTQSEVRTTSRLGVAPWLHAGGLLLAAVGVLVQFLTGVPGFPPVPPGPIILAVAALVVVVVRWRWIVILGLAVAVFLTVGALASGTTVSLLSSGATAGQLAGIYLQLIGIVIALVAGVVALFARPRRIDTKQNSASGV